MLYRPNDLMTCDVEHTMVKSKALSNLPNPLKILGSSEGL